MPGPLAGIRVLDLTSMVSGPAATALLADQGADVIKIEPLTGDIARRTGQSRGGMTAMFLSINRGKRSLALDLKQPEGAAILRRLLPTADVLIQNFRPSAIGRLGFGEDAVRALSPRIVYVSISGVGETGPYAEKRVYDPVIQALSGMADIQADRTTRRPQFVRTIMADKTAALMATQAITAALFARERTGEGQHVRLAMLDAMLGFIWPEGHSALTRIGNEDEARNPPNAPDLVFEATDGWLTLGMVSDSEWRGACTALGHPEWISDPRFLTPAARAANRAARIALIAEVIRTRSRAEWLQRLDANEVPCAPILRRIDLLDDPQIAHNDLIAEYEQPGFGRVRQIRPAARFDRTPAGITSPAPLLGEHTAALLAEAGYTAEEIAGLKTAAVIGGG